MIGGKKGAQKGCAMLCETCLSVVISFHRFCKLEVDLGCHGGHCTGHGRRRMTGKGLLATCNVYVQGKNTLSRAPAAISYYYNQESVHWQLVV
jgi:hypothetical protein